MDQTGNVDLVTIIFALFNKKLYIYSVNQLQL